MQWNEADLLVSPTATDLVALLVFECGSNGSVIDDEHPDHKGRIRITAYFPLAQEGLVETIREKMGALESRGVDLGDWKVVEKKADDKDWLFAWQEHFHPKKISRHFWAAPAWEPARPADGEDVLSIDPGLAIAAAKLGASRVTAVDFDAVAVKQAAVNAKLNGVEERLTIANSDLLAAIPQGEQADVVVANLVTNAVLALLPTLPPYLKEGGTLIASGIIDERIDEVRRAAAAVGFTWVDEQFRSGWYAVLMKR